MNENNEQKPDEKKKVPVLPPGMMKKYKGQVLLATGETAEIACVALDHISAMIKLAASMSDTPIAAVQWWMKEETGLIEKPFAPRFVPGRGSGV